MDNQSVKQRFGIIGGSVLLNRAIDTAIKVAPTDLSVLITGESGTGKEAMPQIIHSQSARKHGHYIAVNCGAIPEGTIDSELFGHEKGSFTGATDKRRGYFEEADGGTIFLDEVAELPLQTQVRLLRVLETGEFIKVGSSKPQKTDVRVVAATNVDIPLAIKKGKFREDLFYRLSTVQIKIPPLRDRKEDIHLLFRKFAADFSEKYKMPSVKLEPDAVQILENHRWPGNIRQLKNVTEQLSVIENERKIGPEILLKYLPNFSESHLPAVVDENESSQSFNEREIFYRVLLEMKNEMHELKDIVQEIVSVQSEDEFNDSEKAAIIEKLDSLENAPVPADRQLLPARNYQPQPSYPAPAPPAATTQQQPPVNYDYPPTYDTGNHDITEHEEVEDENLSLEDMEIRLISKALKKYKGRRKMAAQELGISERTLYRKIKEYNL